VPRQARRCGRPPVTSRTADSVRSRGGASACTARSTTCGPRSASTCPCQNIRRTVNKQSIPAGRAACCCKCAADTEAAACPNYDDVARSGCDRNNPAGISSTTTTAARCIKGTAASTPACPPHLYQDMGYTVWNYEESVLSIFQDSVKSATARSRRSRWAGLPLRPR